jgi:hypothetical protein
MTDCQKEKDLDKHSYHSHSDNKYDIDDDLENRKFINLKYTKNRYFSDDNQSIQSNVSVHSYHSIHSSKKKNIKHDNDNDSLKNLVKENLTEENFNTTSHKNNSNDSRQYTESDKMFLIKKVMNILSLMFLFIIMLLEITFILAGKSFSDTNYTLQKNNFTDSYNISLILQPEFYPKTPFFQIEPIMFLIISFLVSSKYSI